MNTMTSGEPLISIVIAVFNGAKTLERCLDSIAAQTYRNREVIVMDGGSRDGTVDILRSRNNQIAYWESTPDGGIYNAWNKALDHVNGQWVCFLGCDDYWAQDSSMERLAALATSSGTDFISGRMAIVNEGGRVRRVMGQAWEWERMKKWQSIAHPGALHNKALFARWGKFSENYRIASDYEFLLRSRGGLKARFVDEVVVCMGESGASRTAVGTVLAETRTIQARHPDIGVFRASLNHAVAWAKAILRRALWKA